MQRDKEDLQQWMGKALNGLVCIVATIGISLGGFSLKATHDAQLSIRELDVRLKSIEMTTNSQRLEITENRMKAHQMQLDAQSIKSDLLSIKEDISEIKQLLKRK